MNSPQKTGRPKGRTDTHLAREQAEMLRRVLNGFRSNGIQLKELVPLRERQRLRKLCEALRGTRAFTLRQYERLLGAMDKPALTIAEMQRLNAVLSVDWETSVYWPDPTTRVKLDPKKTVRAGYRPWRRAREAHTE